VLRHGHGQPGHWPDLLAPAPAPVASRKSLLAAPVLHVRRKSKSEFNEFGVCPKKREKARAWQLARGKGGRKKKNDESDVHLPQRQKKSSHLLCFVFVFIFIFYRIFLRAFFGRFVTRGVQKHEKNIFWKVHLGSSQKMRLFFPPFFFPLPRLFCSIFLIIAFLGVL
jgi:hypothetical protein